MSIVKLDQKLRRLEVKDFEIQNEVVFSFFDKVPSEDRDEKLLKAVYIGVLALMEDRFSSFLSKTANELGTELESLKMIFEMKKEIFYKTALKGALAESDIADFLNNFFQESSLKDEAILTGSTVGSIQKNKTGDIVCNVNGKDDVKIIIECKFDKSIKLGDISTRDVFSRKTDTVWSQLLEAEANRQGKVSLIVLDMSLIDGVLLDQVKNVRFIPAIGFVVIVDSQKGDYSNLSIAYMLARDVVLHATPVTLDKDILSILVNRIIKDINEILDIKQLVESNITNNKKILLQLEKSILLTEFNQKYLSKFLQTGLLDKEDLLNFYMAEDIRDKYKAIEKHILETYSN